MAKLSFFTFSSASGGTPRNFGGKNYFFIVLHKKPSEIKLFFRKAHPKFVASLVFIV